MNVSQALPMKTYEVVIDGEQLIWPANISDDAYTLSYSHSNLSFNKTKPIIKHTELYEAWAFDGKKSWHIWNRHGTWVCTEYDAGKDSFIYADPAGKEKKNGKMNDSNGKEVNAFRREQLLLTHFANTMNKKKLIIHERIAYDDDNQAYIAYACPIELSE